jgi:hypothetical protein
MEFGEHSKHLVGGPRTGHRVRIGADAKAGKDVSIFNPSTLNSLGINSIIWGPFEGIQTHE